MSTTLAKPRTRSASAMSSLSMLRQEMDELMTRFWEGDQSQLLGGAFKPTLDLSETDDRFELRMDIPGMQASEIELHVQGNTVTLSGSRKEEKSDNGKTFHRLERHTGAFSRTVTLPCNVREQDVTAQYAGGVLSVTLPKCKQQPSHRIEVKG